MPQLDVYITKGCWNCAESRRIVRLMQSQFPSARIRLLDMDTDPVPDTVFAAPTYVLNGRVVSIGNPRRDDLAQQLRDAQKTGVRKVVSNVKEA